MRALLIWVARVAGVVGTALIVVAALARLSGVYWLGGFQSATLLLGGMAAVLLACLGYLAGLAEGPKE